jgi:predicted membrane protein
MASMSTNLVLAAISIIFGILIIVVPEILAIIVVIFFILLGIYLVMEALGERKGTQAPQAPPAQTAQVSETTGPENK